MTNPYLAYKNVAINTASKEQLLLSILDGSVRYSKIARQALIENNIPKAHENIIKVQEIYIELIVSLDTTHIQGGDNLIVLYKYIKDTLVEVNIKKDRELLDKIIPLIEEIRNMWYEVYSIYIKEKQ